jgi:hypothetical protein
MKQSENYPLSMTLSFNESSLKSTIISQFLIFLYSSWNLTHLIIQLIHQRLLIMFQAIMLND